MDINSLLSAPMALIRQAVAADTRCDFIRAIDLYEEGSNPKLKALLESRIQEYNDRIEYLLQQIDKTLNPPSDVPEAPFFDPSGSQDELSTLQRKEYEDHHPHRVPDISAPNLPAFEGVSELSSSPMDQHDSSSVKSNDMKQNLSDTSTDEWVYVPEVIPDAPNFASIGFGNFHLSFGPAVVGGSNAANDDDDVFRLSQRSNATTVTSKNQMSGPGASSQQPSQQQQAGPLSSSAFQQPKQQAINGKVYHFGANTSSPYGTGSAAMASMKNDLQLALDTAETAKEEDKKKNYQKAFLLYRRALDYFVHVLNADLNQYTRQSLNKTVKLYVTRAEKLKEYLQRTNQLPEDDTEVLEPALEPPVPFSASVTSFSSVAQSIVPEPRLDLDIRVGPTVKEAQTSFWNDSAPLFIRVDIQKNLVTPGDTFNLNVLVQNRSSIKVSELRVGLVQVETLTTIDLKAQRKVDTKSRPYNVRSFRPDGAFPLKSSTWQGFLEYWVPGDILFTDADFSTSFSREHKLVITCIIPYHNDLSLELPIRVVPHLAADGSANPNMLLKDDN